MTTRVAIPAAPQPARTWLVVAGFAAVACALGWRLYDLQFIQNGHFQRLAQRQETRVWRLPAPRGSIRDRLGQPLAVSTESWVCYADPDYMDEKLRATIDLAGILDVPREELRGHFDSGRNGRLLAKGLDEDQKEAVEALGLAGIYLRPQYQRDYPMGSVAASVIGFLRADGNGAAGVESRFNANLCGIPGQRLVRVDAHGRPLLDGDDDRLVEPARPGQHIQLSLDVRLQQRAEELLAASIEHHQAEAGAVIAIRPATGDIVAMASWPTFDLITARDQGVDDLAVTRNQAIQIVYESGSTMKPLVAGAAVSEGLVRWDEKIFCENGRWTYSHGRAKRTIHDHSYSHGGHQWLTVAEGVAKSDNILMAKLGVQLGPDKLFQWVKHFGFGEETGIDLAGESGGVVHPLRKWTPTGACMSVPIGHEFSVTPLQMALVHAAVANRGLWNPPRLIERIFTVEPESGRVRDLKVPPLREPRRIFAPHDAVQIQDSMRLVMEAGTGKRSQLDGYSSAGKTGTTEKLIDGRYADDRHIGSFVCWAPAEHDRPAELLVLAVIDDPRRNGHYGSQTAAPIVQELLQYGLEEVFRVPRTDEDAAPEGGR